jgi:hypothetical protein
MRCANGGGGHWQFQGSGGRSVQSEHCDRERFIPRRIRLARLPASIAAKATFPEGDGHRRRLGAGAEYRVRDWRASAEVSAGYDDDTDVGLSVAGDWWMNDYWNFEAEAETSTNDIPLQGRPSGVRGKSLRVGATYRVSESRTRSGNCRPA